MHLPHSAHEFLKEALAVSEKGAVIHLCKFENQKNLEKKK